MVGTVLKTVLEVVVVVVVIELGGGIVLAGLEVWTFVVLIAILVAVLG